jgi:predicted  nucleic acid-binding Zn-ribbon protein
MSPEQVLLLQVLRRAKPQQDLVIKVQKNLESLTNIQKNIEKIIEQVKHLQSVIKGSQKQIIQIQRKISAVERSQEKEFAKLRTQIRGGRGALLSVKERVAKNKRKRKKIR